MDFADLLCLSDLTVERRDRIVQLSYVRIRDDEGFPGISVELSIKFRQDQENPFSCVLKRYYNKPLELRYVNRIPFPQPGGVRGTSKVFDNVILGESVHCLSMLDDIADLPFGSHFMLKVFRLILTRTNGRL